jgi:hypothetical protein
MKGREGVAHENVNLQLLRRKAALGDAAYMPVAIKDALAGKHGEYDLVLANPPFGKKSSVTIVNEAGGQEKESLVINRDDFWATASRGRAGFGIRCPKPRWHQVHATAFNRVEVLLKRLPSVVALALTPSSPTTNIPERAPLPALSPRYREGAGGGDVHGNRSTRPYRRSDKPLKPLHRP